MKDETALWIMIGLISIGIGCIVSGTMDLMQSDAGYEALRASGMIPESISTHIKGISYVGFSLIAFIFAVLLDNHQLRKNAGGKQNERTERD